MLVPVVDLTVEQVVRALVERAMRRQYRVLVGFEQGAAEFDCDFAAAVERPKLGSFVADA